MRHLRRRPIRDRAGRPQILGVAHGRAAALAQRRHLERKIGPAHAGPFDRLDLHDAGADLDRARLQALDLGRMPPGFALAHLQQAAPTTGKRQQHAGARYVQNHTTLHAYENAGSLFNEASTLSRRNSLRLRNP
jgi:hypothetical protein